MMRNPFNFFSAMINRVRRPRVWRFTRQLTEHQWWSTDDLLRFGEKQARSLAIHAFSNVPYYQDAFRDLGIKPDTIIFPDDWKKIPILKKDMLRSNFTRLTASSDHVLGSMKNASGGSTGKPVSFLSDLTLYDMMDAFMNLVFSWAGWKPGEMCIHLWGGEEKGSTQGLWDYAKTLLGGRLVLPVYSYDEHLFKIWWKKINMFKPSIIYAYPSVAADFGTWLEDKGYEPRGIKGVFCSAEMLFPRHREVIGRAFGCKVYNQYGSREAPAVGCECPHGNMHIFVDINYVEFLDQPSGDEEGMRMVVTPLYNYAQPLLRYDLDDVGTFMTGSCPCGRGYPLMKMEIGRQNDYLQSLDGKKIYPSFLVHLLDGEKWIRHFQFVQVRPDKVDLIVEPEAGNNFKGREESLTVKILSDLKTMMGHEIKLQVSVVDAIQRTATGKFRHVVSAIDKTS